MRTLHIGIETGLDDVLEFMNKDHRTMAEAAEAIDRLHSAGLSYGAHIMTGVVGAGRGIENAEALAEFLIRTKPLYINNFSIFLHEGIELYEDIVSGRFSPASEEENLLESKRLIELLAEGANSDSWSPKIDDYHDCLAFAMHGSLPASKEKASRFREPPLAST